MADHQYNALEAVLAEKKFKVGNTSFERPAKAKASTRAKTKIIQRGMFKAMGERGDLWPKNKSGNRTG